LAAARHDDVRLHDVWCGGAERRPRCRLEVDRELQPIFIDDENLVSGAGQQERGETTGSAGTNDHDPHSTPAE